MHGYEDDKVVLIENQTDVITTKSQLVFDKVRKVRRVAEILKEQ